MREPTLEDVLARVDATVLHRVDSVPALSRVTVTDVAILDPADHYVPRAGSLLLAVGVEPDSAGALEVIDEASRSEVAAVVFRSDGELPAELLTAARRGRVALLAAPVAAAWGQLYSLLLTATTSAAADRGASGVSVGDLFSLADAIATAVGGPVTIEDPHWRVLAYSNLGQAIDEARRDTILGRAPPPEWQVFLEQAGVAKQLRESEGVVRFEGEGIATRLAAPVRAGGQLLGSIWLAVDANAPRPDVEEQLLNAAGLAAMHLLAHRSSEDFKRRARGEAVGDLLDGVSAGHRSPPVPIVLVAFDVCMGDRHTWRTSGERVLSLVSLFAETAHREAMCALLDERIWALVPIPSPSETDRVSALVDQVVRRVGQVLDLDIAAVIGPTAASAHELPLARQAVDRAFAVLDRRPELGPIVHVDAVRAAAILHELLELAAESSFLRSGPLAAIAGRGDQLLTLRAYLDAHGDVPTAAAGMGVHPNTFRYRLRRVLELTGLDLTDADERLVTEVQLRLVERDEG